MLTADILYGFTSTVLFSRFEDPKPIPLFHREMWEMCCSEHKRVAIAAPRGFAKSTAITHAFTLASVLYRTAKYVVIVSDTESQAVQFLGDIRLEFRENEDLLALFGVRKILKDAETDMIVQMTDGYEFRIVAKGSEQKIRGSKWRGTRPDLVVVDDAENDEIVMNPDRREKFRRWVYGAMLPMMSDKGRVRWVGTILHLDSMLERLLNDPGWYSRRYKAHNEDFSELLWSEKWSVERLKEIRQGYINQGFPEGYAQEYLNYPIDESSSYFRKSDFLPIPDADRHIRRRYYAAVDFAITNKERSDYTVITVGGVDASGRLDIVDVRRGRWDSLEIINEMFSVQKRYEPDLFTAESGAIEKALGPFLNAEMLKTGVYLNLNSLTPTKDKQSRARGIQARMRAGGVRFDLEADWFPDLQSEMLHFPRGAHDDQVDSIAWLGLTLDQLITAQTDKELEDEYYAEAYEPEVNLITGY